MWWFWGGAISNTGNTKKDQHIGDFLQVQKEIILGMLVVIWGVQSMATAEKLKGLATGFNFQNMPRNVTRFDKNSISTCLKLCPAASNIKNPISQVTSRVERSSYLVLFEEPRYLIYPSLDAYSTFPKENRGGGGFPNKTFSCDIAAVLCPSQTTLD